MSSENRFSLRSLIDGTPSPPDSTAKPANPASEVLRAADPPREVYEAYQTDLAGFCHRFLDFTPWSGENGQPGQRELFEDISESVRRQLDGDEDALKRFRVESCHGVGKTYGLAAIVNWFFTCFTPSETLTTAPTAVQVERLLWKDIRKLRRGRPLPGVLLPKASRLELSADHYAEGATASDSDGKGEERSQGTHAKYFLIIFDEAEGVPEFFFDSAEAMMTGGTVMLFIAVANPKTRSSAFHRLAKRSGVKSYRFSAHDFPNVARGEVLVPGGTTRRWVCEKIEALCEVVAAPDEEKYTFTLPWEVRLQDGRAHPPGTIFLPDDEYLYRVMGVPPISSSERAFVATGVYEAAQRRAVEPGPADIEAARIGVDVARFGSDKGKVYLRHRARARLFATLSKLETDDYVESVKKAAKAALAAGARSVHVRVDGTGGFGAGVVDGLRKDAELRAIPDFKVFEVHFASAASDPEKYDDIITECYAQAGETLKGIRLEGAPPELETDLTERHYEYVNRHGKTLKKLEPKEKFRQRHESRSPDDGDALVLALAPDFVFRAQPTGKPAFNPAELLTGARRSR